MNLWLVILAVWLIPPLLLIANIRWLVWRTPALAPKPGEIPTQHVPAARLHERPRSLTAQLRTEPTSEALTGLALCLEKGGNADH